VRRVPRTAWGSPSWI